jgi:RNA polymerase sigma factor (sigma-70 family)
VRLPKPQPALPQNLAMTVAPIDEVAAIARQYGPTVFRAAWRILGSRAAAEDVQQQLFLRLIESPPKAVQSWPAFLTASATRLAIDVLRRNHRWRLLAPLWKTDEPEDSPAEDAERAESARFMRRALARLNARDASCFVMRHFHDLAPAAIGAALGMTENHVSVAVHRARKTLEKIQEEQV